MTKSAFSDCRVNYTYGKLGHVIIIIWHQEYIFISIENIKYNFTIHLMWPVRRPVSIGDVMVQ